jgi:hypothetical protein
MWWRHADWGGNPCQLRDYRRQLQNQERGIRPTKACHQLRIALGVNDVAARGNVAI